MYINQELFQEPILSGVMAAEQNSDMRQLRAIFNNLISPCINHIENTLQQWQSLKKITFHDAKKKQVSQITEGSQVVIGLVHG